MKCSRKFYARHEILYTLFDADPGCAAPYTLLQNFVGVDASTFSVAVQQQRQLRGTGGGGKEVFISIKSLPDFHMEMMRLGSHFSSYPSATDS